MISTFFQDIKMPIALPSKIALYLRNCFKDIFAAFILFSLFISCKTVPETISVNSEGVMIVEAEDMTLTSAGVIEFDRASGRKAILLLAGDAEGSIMVDLPRGKYVVNAYFSGSDFDHDGIFLAANGKMKRTAVSPKDKLAYGSKFLIFETDGSEPVHFQITSSWESQPNVEFDLIVDRLEIAEFCNSSEVMERWEE